MVVKFNNHDHSIFAATIWERECKIDIEQVCTYFGVFLEKKQIFLDSKRVRVYFHANQTTSAFNRCFKDGYVAQLVRAQHS